MQRHSRRAQGFERRRELRTVHSLYGDVWSFAVGAGVVVAACAITAALNPVASLWLILGLMSILTALRLYEMLRFERDDARGAINASHYTRSYLLLGSLHVLMIGIWCMAIILLRVDPICEIITLSTAVGFMVGIQGRNFASPATVHIQLVALSVPLELALVLRNSPLYYVLGAFFAVFVLSVIANSRRVGNTFQDALTTSDVNEDMAYSDSLTKLPNRAGMRRVIDAAIARPHQNFALHFIDLDKFKRINDTLGHGAGDQLLQIAGKRFATVAGDGCIVSRHAGDEFLVLQPNVVTQQDAVDLAERLIASCECPFDLSGSVANIGCSIGIALFPRDGTSTETIMQRADLALYHVKKTTRNSYIFFAPQMSEVENERMTIENKLRHALSNDELYMVFQPIIDTATTRVSTFEALIRWHRPDGEMIPPDLFLPIAEDTGLINAITDLTFEVACRTATTLPPDISVAVNLSPSQLMRPDIEGMVTNALARHGLIGERLEIELTENLFVDCSEEAIAVLRRLRDAGISFSIDDFGTGYSNLGYLNTLPIDTVKIDRSFLTGAMDDARKAAVLRSLIAFISDIDLKIVLEGIETDEQIDFVLDQSHNLYLQGFVFGTPLTARAAREFAIRKTPLHRAADLHPNRSLRQLTKMG